jgi:hypothetical protein
MRRIPWIPAAAEVRIIAGATGCKFVEVEGADDHRARGLEFSQQVRMAGAGVARQAAAGTRAVAWEIEYILYRDRHTVQRTAPIAVAELSVELLRQAQGRFVKYLDETIDLRIVFVDALQ